MLSKPIFIVGAHKSGTSLLRSLLDGTPGLFVFPKEPHYFSHTGWPITYPLRRQAAAEDAKEHLRRSLEADNRDTNPYSDLPDFSGWNIGRFWSALGEDLDYPSYIRALRIALTGSNGRERVVDKSTEYIEFVPILTQWFPDARFIHVIRNPYANLVSLRRYRMKRMGRYPVMYEPAAGLRFSADTIARNQRIAEHYAVVRYEDLVQSTERTMRSVAEHIGVDLVREMLRPTVMGAPWRGNSSADELYEGVSTEPLERWRTEITPFERALTGVALRPYFDSFRYAREPAGVTLLPTRGEGPRTYVINRAILRLPW